jgi:DNA polymerase III subunit beta
MEVQLNRSQFAKAFNLVSSVANPRHDKPVLACVRAREVNGKIKLYATDTEVSIACEIDCEVQVGFDCLLPVAKFKQVLSECSDETITIGLEGSELIVMGAASKFRFPSIDPKEFPTQQANVSGETVKLSALRLREMFRRTQFCTDTDSTRYALGGVLLTCDGTELHSVGTDGRRLATDMTDLKGESSKLGAIVPLKAIRLIEAACDGPGEAVVFADNNAIQVIVAGCELYSRLIEGRYPSWMQVLPKMDGYQEIAISAPMLLSVVKQAAIVADNESRGLEFNFSEGNLEVCGQTSGVGNSRVQIPIPYSGEPVKLTANSVYVMDFLRIVGSDGMTYLNLKDGNSPIMFRHDEYQYVVMPMARE